MLLRTRSIVVQALVLGIITAVNSQNYDAEYNANNDESDDHSEYTGGEGGGEYVHPDYSKFYSVDDTGSSGALAQGKSDNGFVTPIEFSTFFGTPNFAYDASNKQEILKPLLPAKTENLNGFVNDKDFRGFSQYDNDGFGSQDFFEQAQKQKTPQNEAEEDESDEVEPNSGPSYISHRLPAKTGLKSEVENFRGSQNKPQPNTDVEDDLNKDEVESDENYKNFKPSPLANLAQFQPSDAGKGLLSEEDLTNLPYVNEFYKKYTPSETKATPYQKYSFQPTGNNLGAKQLVANAFQNKPSAPFNPAYSKVASNNFEYQPSEVVQKNVKSKECVKINKQVSDKNSKLNKQPMQCFVCNDPKSGAKYERCSYSNEPSPKSYFSSTSHSHGNPDNFRNKRDESESYSNPYDEVKSKSHGYNSQPDDFEKDFYKSPTFEEFNYSPEAENEKEEEEDKSYSEVQSEALVKQGENCRKSRKNGVTCTVCTDPKTKANFEQCSYESEPNEKQYAYVSEKKFDGDGNPVEEREEGSTEPKAVVSKEEPSEESEEVENYEDESDGSKAEEEEEVQDDGKQISKLVDDGAYDIPLHFEEDTYRQKQGSKGLDPDRYGSSEFDSQKKQQTGPQKFSSFDDYHLKLFPHLAKQESRRKEARTQPNTEYFEDSSKQDVEKVLEEFSKKDRSNCKQVNKKGMTCYLCIDKHGIQQEECMYVSESKPQSSHIAYHEVQQLKPKENNTAAEGEESRVKPIKAESDNKKRKTFFKKATTSAPVDYKIKNSERSEKFDSTTARYKNYERDDLTKISTTRAPRYKHHEKRDVTAYASDSENYKKSAKNTSKNRKIKKNDKEPKPKINVNDEDGLHTAETQPVYSKKLGLTLPKYMLDISPLEADFDRSVANL